MLERSVIRWVGLPGMLVAAGCLAVPASAEAGGCGNGRTSQRVVYVNAGSYGTTWGGATWGGNAWRGNAWNGRSRSCGTFGRTQVRGFGDCVDRTSYRNWSRRGRDRGTRSGFSVNLNFGNSRGGWNDGWRDTRSFRRSWNRCAPNRSSCGVRVRSRSRCR